jgi:YidC/Oxa1 family membrane protein insertase
MNFLAKIYQFIFYQPIFNFLSFLVKSWGDFGLAILCLTFFVRLILFPINFQILKNEQKMRKIKDKISEIEKQHKNNPQKKLENIIEIYKKEKINPLFNLLLLVVQFPILFTIYQILKDPSSLSSSPLFLGFFNLSKTSFLFPFLAAVFLVLPSLRKKAAENFFVYFSSFFTFLILLKLPAAISLYVFMSYFFGLLERLIVLKKL